MSGQLDMCIERVCSKNIYVFYPSVYFINMRYVMHLMSRVTWFLGKDIYMAMPSSCAWCDVAQVFHFGASGSLWTVSFFMCLWAYWPRNRFFELGCGHIYKFKYNVSILIMVTDKRHAGLEMNLDIEEFNGTLAKLI